MTAPRTRSRGTKLARWMHLLEALLGRRSGLTLQGIIDEVPGYAIPDHLRHADSPEAVRAFKAVRRTFERDKDDLRLLGIPLQMTKEEDETYVYSLRRADFYLPYLALKDASRRPAPPRRARGDEYGRLAVHQFTPDVLAALVEGAVRATEVGDPRLAEAARRALRTLALDLPVDALRQELGQNHAVPAASDPGILDQLDAGVERRMPLAISYHGMRDAAPRQRRVHPLGLFLVGNTWYLAARDADEAAATDSDATIKNFRVSRIAAVTSAGAAESFAPALAFDLAAHARSRRAWDLGDGDALPVDVEFRGERGVVLAAAKQGEPIDGVPAQRRFQVRRPEAFIRWVAALAPDARIVAPPGLADELRAFTRATRAHHAGGAA